MNKKEAFGGLLEQNFNIGDIVEWSTYNQEIQEWIPNYGIIITIDKELSSGSLVSVSRVLPINGPQSEIKFFTASLKSVSKTNNIGD